MDDEMIHFFQNMSKEDLALLTQETNLPNQSKMLMILFASQSSMYSSYSNIVIKLFFQILGSTDTGDDEWIRQVLIIAYIMLTLLTLVYNLIFLNELFRYFGTLKGIPPYQSLLIIMGMMTGGIILNEFDSYSND